MIKDLSTRISAYLSAALVLAALAWILQDIIATTIGNISFEFIFSAPESAGRKGGIFPIIVSTFLILGICMAVVVPVGLGVSIFLAENGRDFPRFVGLTRRVIEILAGVPSIVFGLFGNAFFCIYLGMGFSILSGGLTLALMALPLFIVTVEEGLRSVPQNFRLLAKSIGLSDLTMIFAILVPYALPSIIVGMVLAIGRALAETAALIFTSGYVTRMPESIFDSGRALSVHIYDLAMNVPGGEPNAQRTAFILVFSILLTNGLINYGLRLWYRKRIAL